MEAIDHLERNLRQYATTMTSSSSNRILTSTEKGFIAKYFSSSRLHHLSTWKADLIDFVRNHMHVNGTSNRYRPSTLDERFRTIMHIDMDCFFVSVSSRNKPELSNKAVVVAHSQGYNPSSNSNMNSDKVSDYYSSSEIASCNYEARKLGIKNGMFLGEVKRILSTHSIPPEIVILPYEFDQYDICSKELYRVLLQHSDFVQAVSCDEAYIDITYSIRQQLNDIFHNQHTNRMNLLQEYERLVIQHAEKIRQDIFLATNGCSASVGISHNMLLARLATKRAKPNNIFYLSLQNVQQYMSTLPVSELPGVGYTTHHKCNEHNINTCSDLKQYQQKHDISSLQNIFGEKTATQMIEFAQGIDNRMLENKPRQTLGADINWGVRFTQNIEIERFLEEFAVEVFKRLLQAGFTTANGLTFNLKKKLYDSVEPSTKFLGCGHCQDLSRSMNYNNSTGYIHSPKILYQEVKKLFYELNVPATEIRGVGIHMKKLLINAHHNSINNLNCNKRNNDINTMSLHNDPYDEDGELSNFSRNSNSSRGNNKSEKFKQSTLSFTKVVPGVKIKENIIMVDVVADTKVDTVLSNPTHDVEEQFVESSTSSNEECVEISTISNTNPQVSAPDVIDLVDDDNDVTIQPVVTTTSNKYQLSSPNRKLPNTKKITLTSFFTTKAPTTVSKTSKVDEWQQIIIHEKIDMNIWNSLPKQLQEEQKRVLIDTYRSKNKKQRCK